MSKEKKVAVTFKKPWRGYNKDEVAGFDEDTAEALADAGVVTLQAQAKTARGKQASAESGGEKTAATKTEQSPPADTGGAGSAPEDERP
ncbi:hypothetical protein GCM10010975_26600 [Comamonas phosphati]|nr:hypothetical protein GCM10010975_26600 [Comamonas phosphati]